MFDVYEIESFVDEELLAEIRVAVSAGSGNPAAVYGTAKDGAVEPSVRSVARINIPTRLQEQVTQLLVDRMTELGSYFGTELAAVEEPQFLRYSRGDHFVAHQDGNTPLIRDETLFRRVSVVVFLSDPGDHTGGSLVLHGSFPQYERRFTVPQSLGSLVAFRSKTTHEVTPVTDGTRCTIVSWYRTDHSAK